MLIGIISTTYDVIISMKIRKVFLFLFSQKLILMSRYLTARKIWKFFGALFFELTICHLSFIAANSQQIYHHNKCKIINFKRNEQVFNK